MRPFEEEETPVFYEKKRSMIDLSTKRRPSLLEKLIDEDEVIVPNKKKSSENQMM